MRQITREGVCRKKKSEHGITETVYHSTTHDHSLETQKEKLEVSFYDFFWKKLF